MLQLLLKQKGFKSLLLCINCAEGTITQFLLKCTSILKDSSGKKTSWGCLFLPFQCFLYAICSLVKQPGSFLATSRSNLFCGLPVIKSNFASLDGAVTSAVDVSGREQPHVGDVYHNILCQLRCLSGRYEKVVTPYLSHQRKLGKQNFVEQRNMFIVNVQV